VEARHTHQPDCVGALIRDEYNRVYIQRRSPTRRMLPGIWDVVGGHLEAGETPEEGLAREITEETGWRLRRIEAVMADWEWAHDGVVRRELDYLVEVDGDLGAPQLEQAKHDAFTWVGPDNMTVMLEGDGGGNQRLRDIVAKATRVRLTDHLRLMPIGPEYAADLWELSQNGLGFSWPYAWTKQMAKLATADYAREWDSGQAQTWLAYERAANVPVGYSRLSLSGGCRQLDIAWIGARAGDIGHAVEIGGATLAFAFEDLAAHQVMAYVRSDDKPYRTVLGRLAMHHVGDSACSAAYAVRPADLTRQAVPAQRSPA
jgi:8-oxo-dGTP pyrophosphatase MutT (NUDIX family)/RimJ/RimL family protein N-acetyltransferase